MARPTTDLSSSYLSCTVGYLVGIGCFINPSLITLKSLMENVYVLSLFD